MDTRNHFCLFIHPDSGMAQPVIISLTSTQIKKSKNWNHIANNIVMKGANGNFKPPLFSHVYDLSSVGESNDSGAWKGLKVELSGKIEDAEHYRLAKELADIVKAGEANVDYSKVSEAEEASVVDADNSGEEFE